MKQIRESKFSKIVAYYLILMILLQITQPMQMYALTSGPTQPEFNAFTPIGTSDMVDLSSGDFNYNIPIMDVGGYPLNLAYNSGGTMDEEASWVGLGWNLNVGEISRQVRGLPDDFNGDKMIYENSMKDNVTLGANFNVFLSPFGVNENHIPNNGLNASIGLGVKYNNYDGYGFSTNGGLTYSLSNSVKVGMNLESSSTEGVTVTPSATYSHKYCSIKDKNNSLSASLGVSLNSRKGLEQMSFSVTNHNDYTKTVKSMNFKSQSDIGTSGSLSFVDASFTPTKRVAMTSSNFLSSFNVETSLWGVDPGFKLSGFRTSQGMKSSEKYKIERGFGYENTDNASQKDILDFNREKDRTVNKSTVSLPVTNYTYDIYNVKGQGISGMFRPYRGQVGYVFDKDIRDDSSGGSIGGEAGVGPSVHAGIDISVTSANSSTGLWIGGNNALNRTIEKKTGNSPNYEKVFFKNVGGFHVDKDMPTNFKEKLGGYNPITFKISDDGKFNRDLSYEYNDKFLSNQISVVGEP